MTADAYAGRSANRRAALLALAGAVAWPALARAQTTVPTLPRIVPPAPAPVPATPPAPAPAPTTARPAIDATKAYYLFFNAVIDYPSMLGMRRQLTTLVEAGVPEITIVITSVGGIIEPALLTYDLIRALPARINAHAEGLVASAANILFLAGQQRSADRSARFLFHPATYLLPGVMNEQEIHDRLDFNDTVSKVIVDIYHERTTLTDQDIAKFNRGQVIYDANAAHAAGVVQTVGDLRIPGGQRARVLFLD